MPADEEEVTMRATINGFEMNFETSGPARASAVVLHHPLATNLTIWDELTRALEPNYRVVRMDARGHGLSEAPKGPYDFETLAGDVVKLMDHLAITKARFLGLSMGGMVGQYLGFLHPSRFHSLCLVSTSSAVPSEALPLWDERIRTASSSGMSPLVEGAMARWVAPNALHSKPALVARLRAMIESTPPEGYVGWCQAIRTLNVTSRLKEVRLPTRVIVGALDPATPPAAAEVIHREIQGSDLIVIPGVSHMLHVEEPEAFHAAVLPFMGAHGPAA
jgi:3-oxoadipate enol-lactonase